MATWPTGLIIERSNYQETPPDRQLRSQMDIGPNKVRRRSTAAVRKVKFNLFLTSAQLDTFDTFYLENDSISFIFPDPRTETNVDARFTAPPVYNLNETFWDVSVELEILP